nr:unnamed protein product [Callosobruchus chinensis]
MHTKLIIKTKCECAKHPTVFLGPLADSLQDKVEVPYEDIPLFPTSTVAGHAGKLVFGKVGDVPVVCMKGRFHAYEGYPLWKVVMPVRVMRLLGAEYLIVTNAAGGIPEDYNVGDMMIIKDHVNFMGLAGQNPLRGPNMEEFGPRFPAMNKTYDRGLVKAGLKIAESLGMKDSTHEGVYACIGGPNYETIAEYALMKTCGIDAVGMSTAHEVIVAGHCGMKVFAFSLISDKAIFDYESAEAPNHEAVMAAVKASEENLQKFTEAMIKHMGSGGLGEYTYDQIEQVAKFLQKVVPNFTPKVGIICGSGLGPLADSLQDKVEVPYEDIPLFPTSTVAGHGGKLVFGKVGDVPVVCMKGRFHAYEGYPLWKVVMPVRVMRLLGAESLIDHVNMMGMGGQNPLRGPNMEEFGPRFPAMNKAYDREFVKAGRKIAENLGMADITREGVYACLGGPSYETIAELKMLQICGVDSVGMSTAHEVIAAAHCGMKVFAFSLISNKAIMDYDCQEAPNHEEVMAAAKANEDKLKTFTEHMVKYMGGQLSLDSSASVFFLQEAPAKRVSIQEPEGEGEKAEAADEMGEASEASEAPKGVGEASVEELEEPVEAAEEAPLEAGPIGEAPEPPALTEDAALPEAEPDKDVAVGPEEPQSQDYQSQTVEDRAEQTEEEGEPIQEVGIQIEKSSIEDGVAIQTLPETAEAKVGIDEPIVEDSTAGEVVTSVEMAPAEASREEPVVASTEEPVEAPTEKPVEAPTEKPVKAPTEEPVETPTEVPAEEPTEAPEAAGEKSTTGEATEGEKEETESAAKIFGEAEQAKAPETAEALSEVAEATGEALESVKEEVPRPSVECGATVKVECKSFTKCILREANVGPDTPIEPEVKKPPQVKEEDACVAPCKKFMVRKKGDRCPTTCPSKK